jgi:uncharacterized protein
MTWIQTYSGRAVDLQYPDPESIHIDDICIGLARAPRFAGQTRFGPTYTVAQHSLLVERLLPLDATPVLRLLALLHDAHEAYTGDLTTPFQIALRMVGAYRADLSVKQIQAGLDKAILCAVSPVLDILNPAVAIVIKEADLTALAIERRDLLPPSPRPWSVELPDVGMPRRSDEPYPDPRTVVLEPQPFIAMFRAMKWRIVELVRAAGVTPMRSFGL